MSGIVVGTRAVWRMNATEHPTVRVTGSVARGWWEVEVLDGRRSGDTATTSGAFLDPIIEGDEA